MLDFLHIENIAVAKKLDIEFERGFNVLTGETGAGKSVIIGSINMLLGSKVSKDIIRQGENKALVSAVFSGLGEDIYDMCDELGLSYDKEDSFSVSRAFNIDGKNTIKINSQPATLAQLKSIGAKLINVHGQNENHSFMDKNNHIIMLDDYVDVSSQLSKYTEYFSKLTQIKNQIKELIEKNKQTEMMEDLLKLQIKELTLAKLNDNDEDEKLAELKNKLKSAEKIVKSSSNVYKLLLKNESNVSVVVFIDKAIDSLKKLSEFDPSCEEMITKLQEYRYEIEDIAERTLELSQIDGIDNPEGQLEIVEDRITILNRIKKKYGGSIEEAIKYKDEAEEKLNALENGELKLEELKKEYKKLHSEACLIADEINSLRIDGSERLSSLIGESLRFLDMPKVKFKIEVAKNERDGAVVLSSNGYNDVEFLIATNVGEKLSSMNKIASGGELSRIMLALKSALSDKKGANTVIFDEIDTGVSGSTSQKIGIKLAQIGKGTQTICVTHSAQIASLADKHFLIKKIESDGRAQTSVKLLNDEERIDEIARIIGGINLTENQYDAAKDLIKQSKALLNNNK
ncbi:MAG: DNA repair protein RecN [Clostridia bacterium]|nr:DNA repair protein RecN [Clostridia bacterium]